MPPTADGGRNERHRATGCSVSSRRHGFCYRDYRHRHGDSAGSAAARLRSVFHHQIHRQGEWTRIDGDEDYHRSARWTDPAGESKWRWRGGDSCTKEPAARMNNRRPRILLVDDEESFTKVTKLTLTDYDIVVENDS